MTVDKYDAFIFYDGAKAEKAIAAMRRSLGKKNETQAAVKFAHVMLDLSSERKAIEDERQRKRINYLYAYYKMHFVKNKVTDALHEAFELANKVYEEFRALGGTYEEEEAYRTGRTLEEVQEDRRNKKYDPGIDTRNMKVPEPEHKEAAGS